MFKKRGIQIISNTTSSYNNTQRHFLSIQESLTTAPLILCRSGKWYLRRYIKLIYLPKTEKENANRVDLIILPKSGSKNLYTKV